MEVIVQAAALSKMAGVVGIDFAVAGAEAEDALQDGQCAFDITGADEGSEVAAVGVIASAGDENAGEVFGPGYFYEGVGVVIFQENVISGLQILYESAFEEEGFEFGVGFHVFEVYDVFYESEVFVEAFFFLEIAADSSAEVFCFSDVDFGSVFVVHDVDAGVFGEVSGFGEEFFVSVHFVAIPGMRQARQRRQKK